MMLKRILRRNFRQPLYSMAVLTFSLVLTVVLCYLHHSALQEQKSFEETYASVPVTFRVTDLDGSKPHDIPGWVSDLFNEQGLQPNFTPFVRELHTRVSCSGIWQYTVFDEFGLIHEKSEDVYVTGVTSFYVAEELTENWGGQVFWYEGYDESILSTEEPVCLVPECYKDQTELVVQFTHVVIGDGDPMISSTSKTFQVAGYYIDSGNTRLYCPYPVMEEIHSRLGRSKDLEELCAVLKDNDQLSQLHEFAPKWFTAPNPSGEPTFWGHFGFTAYPFALDIDDSMLLSLESSLQSSLRLNQLAATVVFILSAGAGFLTGFLVIRSRKREIALMRSMGNAQISIFTELALEQMLCVAAGIFIGGGYFLWQPFGRLALFGGIYCIGLVLALIIFLWKNLLTTIKEDE